MLYDLNRNRLRGEQYRNASVDGTEGYRYNERNELTERIRTGSHTYHQDEQGSTAYITEESKLPVSDPRGINALSWTIEGTFNGSTGYYELIIDPATNTVWHFVFKSQ